jgi:hypothetical protein
LLSHQGSARLFEVREGRRIDYLVELGERQWVYGLRYQAVSKFERIAREQT